MWGGVVWDFSFGRDLSDSEVSDFGRMLGKLGQFYKSVGKWDVRLWKPDAKDQFLVKSFYNALVDFGVSMEGWERFWDPLIPPRVLAFCWVLRNHKILTLDKLRRNIVIVNGCPICLNGEETVHHLLICCHHAYKVWTAVINLFDME